MNREDRPENKKEIAGREGKYSHPVLKGMHGVLAFFSGHLLADLAWYALISTAVGKGSSFFSDRVYRGVIAACAGFLVVFACYLLYGVVHKFVA